MSRWLGTTNFADVREGTAITIFLNGQIKGDPPPTLPDATDITIELSEGFMSAKLKRLTQSSAIMETSDGKRWRISKKELGDLDSLTTIRDMYSEDWIVREQMTGD